MPMLRRSVAILLLAGSAATAQAPLPAVGVMPVPVEDVSPSSEFVGRVEAVNAVDIRARVQGFVEARPLAAGEEGRGWQETFIIEDHRYEAALSAVRPSVDGAQAGPGEG